MNPRQYVSRKNHYLLIKSQAQMDGLQQYFNTNVFPSKNLNFPHVKFINKNFSIFQQKITNQKREEKQDDVN